MSSSLFEPATHPHRMNKDGSFDSICLVCFRVVASGKREVDLRDAEKAHVCQLADLGYLPKFGPA